MVVGSGFSGLLGCGSRKIGLQRRLRRGRLFGKVGSSWRRRSGGLGVFIGCCGCLLFVPVRRVTKLRIAGSCETGGAILID
jgi:hypothetical protein